MKLVVAIIRPEKLEAVQVALQEVEARLLCVSQVVGDRFDDGFTEIYRGREVRVPRPKLRLEIAVQDALIQATVAAIARTGAIGGPGRQVTGNVFVMQLEECVRIPGGEAEPLAAAEGRIDGLKNMNERVEHASTTKRRTSWSARTGR
jgi:nitrogen regulatory protein P-II 2